VRALKAAQTAGHFWMPLSVTYWESLKALMKWILYKMPLQKNRRIHHSDALNP
jgi:hypothetical protein